MVGTRGTSSTAELAVEAFEAAGRTKVFAVRSRVSVGVGGTEGNGLSGADSISSDGRFVIFESSTSNLAPDDISGQEDVFVHDPRSGETSLVSVASDGTQENDYSHLAGISADGHAVVFFSSASNLVPGDTNEQHDVFVRNRWIGAPLTTWRAVAAKPTMSYSSLVGARGQDD